MVTPITTVVPDGITITQMANALEQSMCQDSTGCHVVEKAENRRKLARLVEFEARQDVDVDSGAALPAALTLNIASATTALSALVGTPMPSITAFAGAPTAQTSVTVVQEGSSTSDQATNAVSTMLNLAASVASSLSLPSSAVAILSAPTIVAPPRPPPRPPPPPSPVLPPPSSPLTKALSPPLSMIAGGGAVFVVLFSLLLACHCYRQGWQPNNKLREGMSALGALPKEENKPPGSTAAPHCKQLAPGSKFCQAPRKAKGKTRRTSLEELMSSAFTDELSRSSFFVGAGAEGGDESGAAHTEPRHCAPVYGKRHGPPKPRNGKRSESKALPPAVVLPPPMVKGSGAPGARTAASPPALPPPASLPPPSVTTGYPLPSTPLAALMHRPMSTPDFSSAEGVSGMDDSFGQIFVALDSQSSGNVSIAAYRSALLAMGMDAAEVNAFIVACLERDRVESTLTLKDLKRGKRVIRSRQLLYGTSAAPSASAVVSASPMSATSADLTPRSHARSVQRQYIHDAEMETDMDDTPRLQTPAPTETFEIARPKTPIRHADVAMVPLASSCGSQFTQPMRLAAGQRRSPPLPAATPLTGQASPTRPFAALSVPVPVGQAMILAESEPLPSASPRAVLRRIVRRQPAHREVVRLGHVGVLQNVETMLQASLRQRSALADSERAPRVSPRAVLRRMRAESRRAEALQQAQSSGQTE